MTKQILAPGAVHAFLAKPSALDEPEVHARCWDLVSEEERARWRRFHFDKNKREFLAGRALLRAMLARYREPPVSGFRYREGDHGKPELDPADGLQFNLTNHPTLVACAAAEGVVVGIDVEPLSRGEQILSIADTVFSPAELAGLEALPTGARRHDRCVSLWTLKEAYIKAIGVGISFPLQKFSFAFDPARGIEVSFDEGLDDPARWWFRTFVFEGHRIALACARPDVSLSVWEAASILGEASAIEPDRHVVSDDPSMSRR